MIKNIIFIFLFVFIFISCEKETVKNPTYTEMLEKIDISCEVLSSSYYISALINGEEYCKYDSMDESFFHFDTVNKFTTSSPTVSTGEFPSNARKGAVLSLGDKFLKQFNVIFEIHFPDYPHGMGAHNYLDSLVNIGKFDVVGEEDVVIPAGTDIAREALLKFGGGYLKNMLIRFEGVNLLDQGGGTSYGISSIFGTQEGSYFRFNELRRINEKDGNVYYLFDIDFECNLYHFEQYGYEGLWGEVREGKILAKVKVEQ